MTSARAPPRALDNQEFGSARKELLHAREFRHGHRGVRCPDPAHLAESECVGLGAGFLERDFESALIHSGALPNQLVEATTVELAVAVLINVTPV